MKASSLITKKMLVLTVLISASLVPHAYAADTDPMDLIPADALFCVRLNNFDQSIGSLDQYLAGATPLPVPLSMMIRPMLGMALGDMMLTNVDTADGSFALFAAVVNEPDASQTTKENIFIGVLIPVKDYNKLVEQNQNCKEPDSNGVSKIAISSMGGNSSDFLIKQAGSMALLTVPDAYDDLIKITKSFNKEDSLNVIIDADQLTAAANSPLWAYANLQLLNTAFAEEITTGIEGFKQTLAQVSMSSNVTGKDGENETNGFEGIADLYIQLFNEMIGQLNALTITFAPDPQSASLTFSLDPVDGSVIQEMLAVETTSKIDKSLSKFIQDAPIMAAGYRINARSLSKYNDWVYDMFADLPANTIDRDDLNAMKDIGSKIGDTIGDTAVFSMATADTDAKFPFEMRYVFKIKDKVKFNEMMDDVAKQINSGIFDNLYDGLGMKMGIKMNRAVDTYKGVSIDSAQLSMGDPNSSSDMDKMIHMIYGGGLDYRIAVMDNIGVYVIGSDSNKIIRQMIDQVKSDESKTNPDFDNAADLTGDLKNTDFFGTYNYVRAIQMSMNMMKNMAGMPGMEDMPAIAIDVETKSNIVFTGNSNNKKMNFQIILPKEHLKEIQAAFQQMMMIQMQQMQKLKEQQQQIEEIQEPAPPESITIK
ncbi:MAG: hypothetical protein FVQ79_11000 [Planctomycetes bacterium]|nr:hypothetical protein [Planctomycetota bacterium]